jgi:hypothetical protein
MRGRPDYGKESADYAVGFTEYLSFLTEEELAWITNPRDGLHTVCKYLPTPADVAEFLKAKRDAANVSFRLPPPQGAHAYFEPEKETSQEAKQARQKHRAEHVARTLGYNPSKPRERIRPPLTEATDEDLKALTLKTPAAPITPQLRELMAKQGWFGPTEYPPSQQKDVAA